MEFYNDNITSNTTVTGVYNGEDGTEGEFTLTQSEPGKFEANIPLSSLGFYNFSVREQEGNNIKSTYKGAFALKYSDEYKFNTNSIKLDTLVKETNGAFINKVEEVFTSTLDKEYRKINLTIPLIILALILFLFDIAYRRLNLDFSKFIKNKDNKNKKKKLKKKDSISEELAMEKEVKVENKYEKVADLKEVANESKKEKNTRSKKEKKQEKPKVQGIDTNALLKKKNDRNGI